MEHRWEVCRACREKTLVPHYLLPLSHPLWKCSKCKPNIYQMFRVKHSHACGKLRNKSLFASIPFRFLFFSSLLKNIPNRWQLFHMTGVGRALTRSLGNQLISLVLVPEKLVPLNHHCFQLWVVLAALIPSVVFHKLFSKTCLWHLFSV